MLLSLHVTIISKPNVPKWSNVIPLWSDEKHPGSAVNSVTLPLWIWKIKAPSVTKTSRGVNPAPAAWFGATAMYFSRQEPNPGSVLVDTIAPLEAIVSTSSEQYGATSKRSGAAATPVGKGIAPVKGVGLEA